MSTHPLAQALTIGIGLLVALSTASALPVLPACADGRDNDADGAGDFPADPGCSTPTDSSETRIGTACDDGVDNDGDGFVDYPADPGCENERVVDEGGLGPLGCDDGIDNDLDGRMDYRGDGMGDPDCESPSDHDECGAQGSWPYALCPQVDGS